MTKRNAAKRPPILMIDSEADTLTELAIARQEHAPQVSDLLLEEIGRAKITTAAKIPADVVTMGSTVAFIDDANGAARTVQLVYPADADISAGRISIMTPIGAGLIGLREGEEILWPDRDGHERKLSIVTVARLK